MTNMTFEVFGFLMLYQDLLIIKFSVAVPTPGFTLLLLLSSHVYVKTNAPKSYSLSTNLSL